MVEQQEEQRFGQGSGGVTGAGFRKDEQRTRLLAQQGAAASVQSRRLRSETRVLAEQGYTEAMRAMLDEVHRLLDKREELLADGRKQLPSREEARLWYLVERLLAHTKHVLPLSVQADVLHRAELPVIPADVLAQLKGIAPSPEAIAALDAGEEDLPQLDSAV